MVQAEEPSGALDGGQHPRRSGTPALGLTPVLGLPGSDGSVFQECLPAPSGQSPGGSEGMMGISGILVVSGVSRATRELRPKAWGYAATKPLGEGCGGSFCICPDQIPGKRDQPLEGVSPGASGDARRGTDRKDAAAGPARSPGSLYLQYSFRNPLSRSMYLAGRGLWASSALSFKMLFL